MNRQWIGMMVMLCITTMGLLAQDCPELLSTMEYSDNSLAIVMQNENVVFIADQPNVIEKYNISSNQLIFSSSYQTEGSNWFPKIDVDSNRVAWYGWGNNWEVGRIYLIDFTSINPYKIGEYIFQDLAEDDCVEIIYRNDMVYVLTYTKTYIIDFSNPSLPWLRSEWGSSYTINYDFKLVGSYLYTLVADEIWGSQIVIHDITNLDNPTQLSITPCNTNGGQLAVSESRAYVVGDKIAVVDISDPVYPTLENVFPFAYDLQWAYVIEELEINQNYLMVSQYYITLREDSLRDGIDQPRIAIYDLTNPDNPNYIGFYDTTPICGSNCSAASMFGHYIVTTEPYYPYAITLLDLSGCGGGAKPNLTWYTPSAWGEAAAFFDYPGASGNQVPPMRYGYGAYFPHMYFGNDGNAATSRDFKINIYLNGDFYRDISHTALIGAGSSFASWIPDPITLEPGYYNFRFVLDPNNVIEEIDENDNEIDFSLYWITPRTMSCSTQTITSGQTLSGVLTSGDCTDAHRGPYFFTDGYSFSGKIGDTVTITMTRTDNNLDPFLYLSDPSGEVREFNDDGPNGNISSVLTKTLDATGTWIIEAASCYAYTQTHGTGSYTINLQISSGGGGADDLKLYYVSVNDGSPISAGEFFYVDLKVTNLGSSTYPGGGVYVAVSSVDIHGTGNDTPMFIRYPNANRLYFDKWKYLISVPSLAPGVTSPLIRAEGFMVKDPIYADAVDVELIDFITNEAIDSREEIVEVTPNFKAVQNCLMELVSPLACPVEKIKNKIEMAKNAVTVGEIISGVENASNGNNAAAIMNVFNIFEDQVTMCPKSTYDAVFNMFITEIYNHILNGGGCADAISNAISYATELSWKGANILADYYDETIYNMQYVFSLGTMIIKDQFGGSILTVNQDGTLTTPYPDTNFGFHAAESTFGMFPDINCPIFTVDFISASACSEPVSSMNTCSMYNETTRTMEPVPILTYYRVNLQAGDRIQYSVANGKGGTLNVDRGNNGSYDLTVSPTHVILDKVSLDLDMPYEYLIPASARASGASQTDWYTDVVLYNEQSSDNVSYGFFLKNGQDNRTSEGIPIPLKSGRSMKMTNMVQYFFTEEETPGSILLKSTTPLSVSSRTYNVTDLGTYGQYIPGYSRDDALTTSIHARLVQLVSNSAYRTNIGLASMSDKTTTVNIDLYRGTGTLIGSKEITLKPYEYLQDDRIIEDITSESISDAFAIVSSSTQGCAYFAYASVVDNESGDPIFIPAIREDRYRTLVDQNFHFASEDPLSAYTSPDGETRSESAIYADRQDCPEYRGRYTGSDYAKAVSVSGTYVYSAYNEAGFRVIDISNPANPVKVGEVNTAGQAASLDVSGTTAFLGEWGTSPGLRVINISSPEQPVMSGSVSSSWGLVDIAYQSGYVYAAGQDHGFKVFDVRNSQPAEVDSLDTNPPNGVDVENQYAYLATFDMAAMKGKVVVINIANPANVLAMTSFQTRGMALDIVVSNNLAYVADGASGLSIYDVASPTSPKLKGYFSTTGSARNVFLHQNTAYVAVSKKGLWVLDVSDPSSPVELGHYDSTGDNFWVSADSSHAAVADGSAGVYILDVQSCGGGSGEAPVADFSWTPSIPNVGQSVTFTDHSTGSPVSWSWNFGDGSTSSSQNPTHSFSNSGSFSISLHVTNDYGSDTGTKSITVTGGSAGQTYDYVFPASAKKAGAYGTNWVTDLVLHNPGSNTASIQAYFLEAGQNNSNAVPKSITVNAGTSKKYNDIINMFFERQEVFGAILMKSSIPIMGTSRTYNDQGTEGTYGQFIQPVRWEESTPFGSSGTAIIQLSKDENYRTNLGLVNASTSQIVIDAVLYRESGERIGTVQFTLKPMEYWQEANIFNRVTTENIENGYARISTATPGGTFFAYASVVDNRTGDPIFIPSR